MTPRTPFLAVELSKTGPPSGRAHLQYVPRSFILVQAILTLRENGRVDELVKDYAVPSCTAQSDTSLQQLFLPSFSGLWFMMYMCWGLAALVTVVERIIIWIGHRCSAACLV